MAVNKFNLDFIKAFLNTILVATILLAISACYNTKIHEDIIEDSEYDDDYFTEDDLVEMIDSTKNKNLSPDTLSKIQASVSFVETLK